MAVATDVHWLHARLAAEKPQRRRRRVLSHSAFVRGHDGVRIALDVHRPSDMKGPLPVIVRQTRYLRSLSAHWLAERLGLPEQFDLYADMRRKFVARGYAWVDVDVRGTGASDGVWRAPWFEDEVRDGAHVVDWICDQEWSSGKVGALGISYDGTCAEMLLVNRHPAVRAVAPMFSLYDVYSDVAFPGGAHFTWFTEAWSRYNAALDRNAFSDAAIIPLWVMAQGASVSRRRTPLEHVLAPLAKLGEVRFREVLTRVLGRCLRGVRDVEMAGDGAYSFERQRERAMNFDVHGGASRLVFRDDRGVHPEFPELTVDSFSPHAFRDDITASGAAIYSYSGWRDAAYPHAAIKRFLSVPNPGSRLTLGPWAHTGKLAIHAFDAGREARFDHTAELLDFFDVHLKGEPSIGDHKPVHYFTLGEEKWKSADVWPPPGAAPHTLHLSANGLVAEAEREPSEDAFRCTSVGSGERTRWRSILALLPGDYPDRRERDQALLCYDSAPLTEALEVTGHPTATIFAEWSDGDDGELFAYLEDVRADGSICYVTEGQLRALHRSASEAACASPTPGRSFRAADARPVRAREVAELSFDLLPISYLFAPGHRIRLALAPMDVDNFAIPRAVGLRVHRGGACPSRLILPIVPCDRQ